jgi:hypothetical protein
LEEEDDCIAQQGVLFIGRRTPPRTGSTRGATARGGSNTRCCASPNPNSNGLWQPIRVRLAAARGRQHPTARVAPPQTLMGCGPVVAAAQFLPIQYSNSGDLLMIASHGTTVEVWKDPNV